ncbi:hypothetical protein Prudu_1499S000700 [Prunus dulcis]|uniref:Uncharacterized protein n=1 Tax=Prunus dulcis TaxID=3755 RepID=A0A5H2XVI8_PRUDU|nr:hypothetical protein Prudu_1499S000700 [Prunus dulcis]
MSLDLSSNNFVGQIPWSFFLNLESLAYLNLVGNNFVGQFPEEVRNSTSISSLTVLYLNENQLNGTIPSWLGSLPSLEWLGLESNQFSGIDTEFQSRSLKYLYLNDNKLHGPIPRSIFALDNLMAVELASNQLSSNIIKFQSRSLLWLDLRDNKLDGMIPRSIYEQVNLGLLDHPIT